MKSGKSLVELAKELERQKDSKRDFLADAGSIRMALAPVENEGNGDEAAVPIPKLDLKGPECEVSLGINNVCHEQIGSKLKIPAKYYDRMRQLNPMLLATNVNAWLRKSEKRHFVRTMDDHARAFLSDRFRALDNFDLAEAILPTIQMSSCRVVSSEITDRRMYIKAVSDKVEGEIKVGDTVQAGVVISNSEVGCGSLRVEPMIFRLVCLNGMITSTALRRFHIGRQAEFESSVREVLSDETKRIVDTGFWAQVRDVTKSAFSMKVFQENVNKLREAASEVIEFKKVETVQEVVHNRLDVGVEESSGVIRHLAQGGDFTRYGLANAITSFSQEVRSYDRATDLERIGGSVIEMPKTNWNRIAAEMAA